MWRPKGVTLADVMTKLVKKPTAVAAHNVSNTSTALERCASIIIFTAKE